jgi:two-component system, OmpR family, sensor histidine kinase KdpD
MPQNRANTFLQMIRRSERGRLKVYLGYGPGVGKTYQMLQEGHRLKAEGIDIVVGLVETHGRADTVKLVEGLDVLPRRKVEYRGIVVDEFDLDACLARNPQVVLVDELAHTNVPGSRNAKRYEDVQELLAAGVHVVTTVNVQHLESLYNTVESLIGVKVRERIPDAVLADADQVVNIDVAPEDLQKRLRAGKIYPPERIASSLGNFFQSGNLEHLRELALRELASQIDARRRETKAEGTAAGSDQIMVCLSSRGPNSARLLRFGSRLAGRLNRNWYAVYVQTPSEDPTRIDAVTQRLLADTLTLANQLGATVFTFKGPDIADTILRFAKEYRVGQIVIGKPHKIPWWRQFLLLERSVAEQLLFRAEGVTITVIDANAEEQLASNLPAAPGSDFASSANISSVTERPTLGRLVSPDCIRVWHDPVSKDQLLRGLAEAAICHNPEITTQSVLENLAKREAQGSTFLNEGVALPHARIKGLSGPLMALGLTHGGILDAPTEKPIEAVFLMLSPEERATNHLQLLASAGRLLQNRDLRKQLRAAETPAEAAGIIVDELAAKSVRTGA